MHIVSKTTLILATAMLLSAGPSTAQNAAPDLSRVHWALADLIGGTMETHFALPFQNPQLYALGFEFLDEINAKCPGIVPDDTASIRETMFGTYTYYHFAFIQGEKLPKGTDFITGSARLLGRLAEAGLPVTAARSAIKQMDPAGMAATTIAATGGCDSETTTRLTSNIAAVATFGRIKYRDNPLEPHFTREEISADGMVRACYYADGEGATTEYSQGYRVINFENFARAVTPIELLIQNIELSRHPGMLGDQPLLMRHECPSTPDPQFAINSHFVMPDESGVAVDSLSGPERMARYFVDDYVPKMGLQSTGVTPDLDEAYKNELKQEIVRFESIEITMADIDREVDKFILAERARGYDGELEPQWRLRQRFGSWLRSEAYRAEFGSALFDLAGQAAQAKGVPNYFAARDYPPLSDMIGQ